MFWGGRLQVLFSLYVPSVSYPDPPAILTRGLGVLASYHSPLEQRSRRGARGCGVGMRGHPVGGMTCGRST